jgi:hypothetical protein
MMNFILMTLSFTVAILLAGAIATAILLHPKAYALYMKVIMKRTEEIVSKSFEQISNE